MGWGDDLPVNRLSAISDGTDICELQSCIYPGGHCPLFGVHLTLQHIAGVTMLVIGTADCGFYAYKTMHNFSDHRRRGARIFSCVLEEDDVIHGCGQNLKPVLRKLDRDPETRMIVVVTSCIIELTGDDIEGIVCEAKKECQTPIAVIRTENFKTADYLQGVEQSLAAVTHLLSPSAPVARSFSVLGPRFQGVTQNRIIRCLLSEGYALRAEFPCNTDWEAIGGITGSSFVIAAEDVALALARRLQQDFSIPFVDFSPSSCWRDVMAAYEALSKITQTSYAQELHRAKTIIEKTQKRLKPVFEGKRFIVGNGVGSPFAAARLVAEIGGEIALILTGNLYEKDREPIQRLLALHQDPLVAKNANLAALDAHSDRFDADFHIGMSWSRLRGRRRPRLLPVGRLSPLIGADYMEQFYSGLLTAVEKEGIGGV